MKKKLASLTLACTTLFAHNAIAEVFDTTAKTTSIGNAQSAETSRGTWNGGKSYHTVGLVNFNASKDTVYGKDKRSDLCFAWASNRTSGHGQTLAITHVPCTDKVEALIKQQKSHKITR